MAEYDYERELGGINAKLEIIVKQQDGIFQRLNEISVDGCASGKRNAKDIRDLKERPERAIAIGAGVISIVGAIIAWIKASSGG